MRPNEPDPDRFRQAAASTKQKHLMDELERIQQEYQSSQTSRSKLWSVFNPVSLYYGQEYEGLLLRALRAQGLDARIEELKILDLGCGYGHELARFISYGAAPENLWGVDLLTYRIEAARRSYPQLHFDQGNAAAMVYADTQFGLITLRTVFSSIFEGALQADIAREIDRVLAPGGYLLWYDMRPLPRLVGPIDQFCRLFKLLLAQPGEFKARLASRLRRSPAPKAAGPGARTQVAIKPLPLSAPLELFHGYQSVFVHSLGLPYHLIDLGFELPLLHYLGSKLGPLRTHWLLLLRKPPEER